MCIQYDLQSIEYFTKILLSWWLGGVNFLESNKNSTGVRHVQKDPLRLGPTSFGPIPELRWQVLDLKMHWFSKCPVLKGNFHLPYFCNHFMYKSFYLWWLLPSLWANKISKKISSLGQFLRLKTNIPEMELFHSTENSWRYCERAPYQECLILSLKNWPTPEFFLLILFTHIEGSFHQK